jgi:uncharacterized protein DUF5656
MAARQYAAWLGLQAHPPRTGWAYLAVRIVVYTVAFAFMVLIYSTKERGLVIAPPVALLGAAATWYLLGDTPARAGRRVLLSAGVGLLLGELTWAFGYWTAPFLVGGAALWFSLHVLSGVVEHSAALNLERRIAIEYVVVALIGALLILVYARPWSP